MDVLRWIVLCVALSGAACNARGLRWGFLCWFFSDFSFGVMDFMRGDYTRAFLQAVYVVIDISGFLFWGRRKIGRRIE